LNKTKLIFISNIASQPHVSNKPTSESSQDLISTDLATRNLNYK